jgi:hypothetical protein
LSLAGLLLAFLSRSFFFGALRDDIAQLLRVWI